MFSLYMLYVIAAILARGGTYGSFRHLVAPIETTQRCHPLLQLAIIKCLILKEKCRNICLRQINCVFLQRNIIQK